MLIKSFLFTTALLVSTQTNASTNDPYNAYLWNRTNALAANGQVDRGDWYEWWYFKVVDPATQEAFYFTYGVVNPWDRERELAGTRAMIQAGDFKRKILIYKSFPVSDFSASYDSTKVRIGTHHATDRALQGAVRDERGHSISWNLKLLPDWKFNAMGWTREVPGSGIYWYPAQASAKASGWVEIDGRRIELNHAPAYQDRNWGRSFPKWWTWITSNHFENSPGSVLAIGGGEPPLFGDNYPFEGLCIGLRHQGHEYVFRSVDFMNSVKFDIQWGTWKVQAQNTKGEAIEVEAWAPPEKFMDLPFPTPRGPIFHDYEALLGDLRVKLHRWSAVTGTWKLVADLHSNEGGIEWGSPSPITGLPFFQFSSGPEMSFMRQDSGLGPSVEP